MTGRPPTHVDRRADDRILNIEAPPLTSEEMSRIGYTPVTCDPDYFIRSGYSLRNYGGDTNLFIAMTMDDENKDLFARTMKSVIGSVGYLCSLNGPKTWGENGWKKVVVCIICDGRSRINKETLKTLDEMQCYEERLVKDTVNDKVVTAHIFERTIDAVYTNPEKTSVKIKLHVIFCLKEQKKKKLNSHRWFFNAFCPLIMPKICVLLDVGTKPTDKSIHELWKCFEKHPRVGGACGKISVSSDLLLLVRPLIAAQNFECKMANIFDKPLESVVGYISSLPDAFSAYRYKALMNGPNGQGPLASYLKAETTDGEAGLFDRNIRIAESRILPFELVTKKEEAWILKYVKSAEATTKVPTTIPEFIAQRRNSINSSLFISVYAAVSFNRIWTSGQGFFRKLALQFLFIYNMIRLFFTWTNLANFYLVFFFLLGSVTVSNPDDTPDPLSRRGVKIVFEVVLKFYISALLLLVVCSLGNGNRPQEYKWVYCTSVVFFGLCSLVAFGFAGYLAGTMNFPGDTAILLIVTYGMYLCSSLLHWDLRHMFTSFFQYIFFLPSYINVLMVYAMCNLRDVTWDTGGDDNVARDLGGTVNVQDRGESGETTALLPTSEKPVEHPRDAAVNRANQDREARTNVLLVWFGTNMVLIIVFTTSAFFPWTNNNAGSTEGNEAYLAFFYPLACLTSVKFFGSVTYLIFRLFGH